MAFDIYIKWWQTWRTLPVLQWVRAAQLYRAGQFEKAETFYLQGLAKRPNHPARFSARLDLAYCLFKARKLTEAEEHLTEVIAQSPNLREAHLRLARLQLWLSRPGDAAWTLRRALQRIPVDSELAALFLIAVIESDGPSYLLKEATTFAKHVSQDGDSSDLLKVAHARLLVHRGERSRGKALLRDLALQNNALFEGVVAFAEVLIDDGEVVEGIRHLRRALQVTHDHPRVLTLLAEAYLKESELYNPDFSRQLATTACQTTNWCAPKEMHMLAEAYLRSGDKMSALIIASKAKETGSRLMSAYPEVRDLDRLIETLSTGTQA